MIPQQLCPLVMQRANIHFGEALGYLGLPINYSTQPIQEVQAGIFVHVDGLVCLVSNVVTITFQVALGLILEQENLYSGPIKAGQMASACTTITVPGLTPYPLCFTASNITTQNLGFIQSSNYSAWEVSASYTVVVSESEFELSDEEFNPMIEE